MITLEVNGVDLQGFTDIDVSRRLDTISGDFSFRAVSTLDRRFPIKTGDRVRVLVENTPVITGYAEYININYSSSDHIVLIRGRDVTADLIDSTLGDEITFTGGVTLEQVVRATRDSINLEDVGVVSNVDLDPFGESIIVSSEVGQKAFDFLEKYARIQNVLLTTDGDGNVVITRSSNARINTQLLNIASGSSSQHPNNITNGGVTNDMTNRYNTYIVRSGEALTSFALFDDFDNIDQYFDEFTDQAVQNSGAAQDIEIRSSRIFDFQAEHPSDSDQCVNRAKWEANYRRAKSFDYYCTTPGFTAVLDGFIWRPNLLVKVIDDFADVNADLLVEQVRYISSLDKNETKLTLVTQDAYQPEPNRDENTAAANKQAPAYNNIDPNTSPIEDILDAISGDV